MRKIFFILTIIFLSFPFSSFAVEIPMGISPKEIVVEKYLEFDKPVEVDKLSDGTPGFLSIERGDGKTKNGDWTRIPIKGINFTLHFWNVGESGGESGFWLWKKNHAEAKLTASFVLGGNGTIMSEGKGFMGQPTFTMEPATHEPDFAPVVFNLTFSGGPDGEFLEKKPYKNTDGHKLWGFVDGGETVTLNIPPNTATGKKQFYLTNDLFEAVALDGNAFSGWESVKEDCIDSYARFSAISGTVEVKKVESGDWKFAKYDAVLCVGDIVRTGEESSAYITWPIKDYRLEEGTQLLIRSSSRKDKSAVEIVTGKIKANFQKALEGKDIYSEEEFPNYVMGIKGTTIEVEAGAEQSIFRLLEGSVGLSYKKDPSKKITVAPGEEITARADGQMEKKTFDAKAALTNYEAEKKTWIKTAAQPTRSTETGALPDQENKPGKEADRLWLAVIFAGLAAAVLLSIFLKSKRKQG